MNRPAMGTERWNQGDLASGDIESTPRHRGLKFGVDLSPFVEAPACQADDHERQCTSTRRRGERCPGGGRCRFSAPVWARAARRESPPARRR